MFSVREIWARNLTDRETVLLEVRQGMPNDSDGSDVSIYMTNC